MDDELVLAAVRRAVLHGPEHQTGAPLRVVLEHLAIPQRGSRAQAVRASLEQLERSGALTQARSHGVPVWALAPAGVRRLAVAERAGRQLALPESPQHAAWQRARDTAERELPRFAAQLATDLAEAQALLAAISGDHADAPDSDAWLALGATLLADCRRVGSGWHCLHEWQEPDDARADRDEPARDDAVPAPVRSLRAGRRNVRLWLDRDER